jgi:predicted acetyltransferase
MQLIHRNTSGPLPTCTFEFVDDDRQVHGIAQVRHRPSCNDDLPPEAANNIYEIAEAHRGRGHGKTLLAFALIEAKRIGLERVRLTCAADNPASRRIIEAHGGHGIEEFVSKRGETFLLLEVSLSEA